MVVKLTLKIPCFEHLLTQSAGTVSLLYWKQNLPVVTPLSSKSLWYLYFLNTCKIFNHSAPDPNSVLTDPNCDKLT